MVSLAMFWQFLTISCWNRKNCWAVSKISPILNPVTFLPKSYILFYAQDDFSKISLPKNFLGDEIWQNLGARDFLPFFHFFQFSEVFWNMVVFTWNLSIVPCDPIISSEKLPRNRTPPPKTVSFWQNMKFLISYPVDKLQKRPKNRVFSSPKSAPKFLTVRGPTNGLSLVSRESKKRPKKGSKIDRKSTQIVSFFTFCFFLSKNGHFCTFWEVFVVQNGSRFTLSKLSIDAFESELFTPFFLFNQIGTFTLKTCIGYGVFD
jgi:hypothetical protein